MKMNRTRNLVLSAALASVMIATASGEQTPYLLELVSRPMVDGPDVLLRDLVSDPAILPASWGERRLGESPLPGKPMEYSIMAIASTLQQYPDMKDVTLRGAVNIIVERRGGLLDLRILENAVRQYVVSNDTWSGSAFDVSLTPPSKNMLWVPPGNADVRITEHAATSTPNQFIMQAAISVDGRNESVLPVKVTLAPRIRVLVARSPMPKGRLIERDDVTVQSRPATNVAERLLTEAEWEDALELAKPVSAGEPLTRDAIARPVCAERGETINVTAQRGPLVVMLKAKAMASGRRGDRISCMNEQSKRRLVVLLTAPREATVDR